MNDKAAATEIKRTAKPAWVRVVIWIALAFLIGSIVLGMALY